MRAILRKPNDVVSFALLYSPLLLIAGLPFVAEYGHAKAALAMVIGAVLSYGSLWLGRLVVKGSIQPSGNKISAISKLQLLLIFKLAIFAGTIAFVVSLGKAATICFLVGYLLVYSCLLAGAIFSRSALVVVKRYPD